MRPLEILLLLGELFTLVTLAVPRFRAVFGMRDADLATMVIAAAQVILEGPRWQMVPAYGLAGVFFSASMLQARWPARPAGGRRWMRRLAVGAAVGVGALALALAAAIPAVVPIPKLPPPHGPYAIGTLTYHWVDGSRPEVFTRDSNRRRELMVQVWYPARKIPNATHAPYVQPGIDFSPLAGLLHLPGFFFDHLRYVTTNAVASAPMVEGQTAFPVLIFSPGRSGFRQHNTFQVEELVSHGYVVAGIDHPYAASEVLFPDGRRVDFDPRMLNRKFMNGIFSYMGEDAVFALNQLAVVNKSDPNGILTGRLDLQRAGIFGTSLGGIVAAEASRLDQRFRACLVIDVFMPSDVVRSGLRQPVMWISRGADSMREEGWAAADINEHQSTMRAVYENLPGDGYLVLIDGIFHANIADFPMAVFSPLARWVGFIGPIDPRRAHAIINAYSLAFFDKYLNGARETLLDGPAKQYPEVHFETRRH